MSFIKSFIKENIFIVLGIALPLLLIAFISIIQAVSKISIDPPHYKIAYLHKDNSASYPTKLITRIDPETKKLTVSVIRIPNGNTSSFISPDATLYIYDAQNDDLVSYPFDSLHFEKATENKRKAFTLPKEVQNLRFIQNTTAPDGYKFDDSYHRQGFYMNLFGHRNNKTFSIVRNGVRIDLPKTQNWPKPTFIGWVENE